MAKKEVTSVMTVQLTSIVEVEESELEKFILSEKDPEQIKNVSDNMREFFKIDDVVVTNMQHFVRDLKPAVPPVRMIFDSEERMEEFIEGILVDGDYCPSQLGLKNARGCKVASCRECWENALKENVQIEGEQNDKAGNR